MSTISLFNAKTHLSRLVDDLIAGKQDQVIVSRHGKPVVRILPFHRKAADKRIGVARGRFEVPDTIDAVNPD